MKKLINYFKQQKLNKEEKRRKEEERKRVEEELDKADRQLTVVINRLQEAYSKFYDAVESNDEHEQCYWKSRIEKWRMSLDVCENTKGQLLKELEELI